MKNIAIIIPCLYKGGAERVAGLLSHYLDTYYNVYLFICDTSNCVYEYGGTIVDLGIDGPDFFEYYIDYYKKKLKIDCSISFLEPMNFANLRTMGTEKVIISERSSQSLINPPLYLEQQHIRELYNYADKIVSISEGVKFDLYNNFEVNKNKIQTIYNFINQDFIREAAKQNIDDDVKEFVGNSRLVINVGRLTEQKNQKRLIKQFSKLVKTIDDVKLLILGKGELEKELQNLIIEYNMEKYIRILPYLNNPFPYYAMSSVFILSSKFEGLSNAILEAMCLGIPVVAVDCLSGPKELISGKSDYGRFVEKYEIFNRGILVTNGNSDEIGETQYLAEAIKCILCNDKLRDSIRKNELAFMKQYSNDNILHQWIDVIEEPYAHTCFPEKKEKKIIAAAKKIIVYGAGLVGKTIMLQILKDKKKLDFLCFAVTDNHNNPSNIFGIPVYIIDDLVEYRDNAVVLVGVSETYQEEIFRNLNRLKFKNIVCPDLVPQGYKYFKEINPSEYPYELALWYLIHTGKELDWSNLRTYNEKIQWLKLYDSTQIKTRLADKYLVREYVKNKIGEKYLIPLLGVWDSFEEIDFDCLPESFVLKCNHGSGWNVIVKDKNNIDYKNLKAKFNMWMKINYAYVSGLEMHYKDIKPKIIAEKLLELPEGEELKDYKLFVFDGKVKLIQVDIDRATNHRRNIYTTDWNYIPCSICYPTAPNVFVSRPNCLDELIRVAEKLSKGFIHVRADFYIWKERIYFGELTFSHGSGTEKFVPESMGMMVGDWIKLPVAGGSEDE